MTFVLVLEIGKSLEQDRVAVVVVVACSITVFFVLFNIQHFIALYLPSTLLFSFFLPFYYFYFYVISTVLSNPHPYSMQHRAPHFHFPSIKMMQDLPVPRAQPPFHSAVSLAAEMPWPPVVERFRGYY